MKWAGALLLAASLQPFWISVSLGQSTDLVQDSLDLAEVFESGDCSAASTAWRKQIVESETAGGAALAVLAGQNLDCLADDQDRLLLTGALITLASKAPNAFAHDMARSGLARLLGPNWAEKLAQTGDFRAMILAAEMHLHCTHPGADHPHFGEFSVQIHLAESCARLDGVTTPQIERALHWYVLALHVPDWGVEVRRIFPGLKVDEYLRSDLPTKPDLFERWMAAFGDDRERLYSPVGDTLLVRMWIADLVELYGSEIDPAMLARATESAAAFTSEPLVFE